VQNAKMMKDLQAMQAKMAKLQAELGDVTVTGSAGGGAVAVEVDGHQHVLSVAIDPDALDDAEMLSDMVLAAVNDALDRSRDMASEHMGQLTAGLNLPKGMF